MPWDFKGELNDVQVFLDFYKIKKKIFKNHKKRQSFRIVNIQPFSIYLTKFC